MFELYSKIYSAVAHGARYWRNANTIKPNKTTTTTIIISNGSTKNLNIWAI